MKHTLEHNPKEAFFEITVEVNDYFAGDSGCTSRLREDCYPPEPAEIDYSVLQIIEYYDEEKPRTITGDNLELPDTVDVDLFEADLMKVHEQKLIDEWDCEDRPRRKRRV